MKSKKRDYLKYWKVIREFTKKKYGVTQADLDLLLFLHSEVYFSKKQFDKFSKLIQWNPKRFFWLQNDKFIEVFRPKQGRRLTIYQLSFKAKRMIDSIYDKLEGEEIPMTEASNPMFSKKGTHRDMLYKNYIIEMNAAIRQGRCDALE